MRHRRGRYYVHRDLGSGRLQVKVIGFPSKCPTALLVSSNKYFIRVPLRFLSSIKYYMVKRQKDAVIHNKVVAFSVV